MKRRVSLCVASLAVGLTVPAIAADMPVRMPIKAPVVVPVVTWTGCYIGGNVGGGWATKEYTDPFPVPPDPAALGQHGADGFVGGGQVGCDYQFGHWVIGAQGMFEASDVKGQHSSVDVFTTRIPWFATATARLGYTLDPAFLVYVKGGGAWVRDEERIFDVVTRLLEGTADVTRTGWTVGFGGEWQFAPRWSLFAEFNYMDFGKERTFFTPIPAGPAFPLDIRQTVQSALVGINFRFGAPAVVTAKY